MNGLRIVPVLLLAGLVQQGGAAAQTLRVGNASPVAADRTLPYAAYPLTALNSLDAQIQSAAGRVRVILGGDTIEFEPGNPFYRHRGKLHQLPFPAQARGEALVVPRAFFTEQLPRVLSSRVVWADNQLSRAAVANAATQNGAPATSSAGPARPAAPSGSGAAATNSAGPATPAASGTTSSASTAPPRSANSPASASATTGSTNSGTSTPARPPAAQPGNTAGASTPRPAATAAASGRSEPASGSAAASARPAAKNQNRVVVIDPGHGGRDPGKPGPNGLLEKNVALSVSNRLAGYLRERGYEVHLTRTRDTLIALDDRPHMANEWKNGRASALFVSIHANSAVRSARGFETFFLSDARTDDERRVAEMENEVVKFEDRPKVAAPELDLIVSSLKNDYYMRASNDLAATIQQHMAKVHPGPNRGVKRAGFRVLVGAMMPAVLVELAFISNPEEAAMLGTSAFQQKIAFSLADAIANYFDTHEHLWTQN